MQHVTTLLANPDIEPLDEHEVNAAVDGLQSSGAIITDVKWLAEGEACDIFFDVLGLEEAQELMGHLLAEVPFDSITQPPDIRKKKLLICDMDSTIIQQECIDELADRLGIKAQVAEITERAMNGELDFKLALRERVLLLKGLEESVLQSVYEEQITLMPGAKELVQTMRENGATCLLVSGGFSFFTSRVRDAVGFHEDFSNQLDFADGKLTGEVVEPILDKEAKLETLLSYRNQLFLEPYETLAVGDGANDLPMLQNAGLGVAFHAKPTVKAQANAAITHCNLDALLYAQGYNISR